MPPDDSSPRPRRIDPDVGKRMLLKLGFSMELVMMGVGVLPAAWLLLRVGPRAEAAWHWMLLVPAAVLVFTYGYLLALLGFRLMVPLPPEGHHPMAPDGSPPRAVVIFMLNVLLVKARHDPPWAAMFASVLTRIWPLEPLFRRFFGPHTTSMTMGDAMNCLDPYYLEAGRNVEFGYNCVVIAHHFDNRGMVIRRVKIDDHAVIGGESTIMAGVEVGHHAVIGNRSVVMPDTKIGPYEFWAGIPARKIKDLPRPDAPGPDGEPSDDRSRPPDRPDAADSP